MTGKNTNSFIDLLNRTGQTNLSNRSIMDARKLKRNRQRIVEL